MAGATHASPVRGRRAGTGACPYDGRTIRREPEEATIPGFHHAAVPFPGWGRGNPGRAWGIRLSTLGQSIRRKSMRPEGEEELECWNRGMMGGRGLRCPRFQYSIAAIFPSSMEVGHERQSGVGYDQDGVSELRAG